jgi:hypothetical protein
VYLDTVGQMAFIVLMDKTLLVDELWHSLKKVDISR